MRLAAYFLIPGSFGLSLDLIYNLTSPFWDNPQNTLYIQENLNYHQTVEDIVLPHHPILTPPDPPANHSHFIRILELNAALDHLPSILRLAEISLYGNYSLPRNPQKALEYYEQAANLGDPEAAFMAGALHSGVALLPVQTSKALLYYSQAARAGLLRGMIALGYRHLMGIGVERSCAKALFYYSSAARKLYNTHILPHSFSGSPHTENFKVRLWDLGGELGDARGNLRNPNGVFEMESLVRRRVSSMVFEGFFEDDGSPLRKHHYAENLYSARVLYEGDYLNKRNLSAAFEEAMDCATKGVAEYSSYFTKGEKVIDGYEAPLEVHFINQCVSLVAHMYLRGEGTLKDPEKAFQWLQRTLSLGSTSDALNDMGLILEYGLLGSNPNPHSAVGFYKAAMKKGHPGALYNMARVALTQKFPSFYPKQTYASNSPGPAQPLSFENPYAFKPVLTEIEIFKLLRIAASRGDARALYDLARLNEAQLFPAVSCKDAVENYKMFIEAMEMYVAPLEWSMAQALAGFHDDALIGYGLASELGFETAQASAAFLLHRPGKMTDDPEPNESPEKLNAAVNYLTKLSHQYNSDSVVLLGDLFYHNKINDSATLNETELRNRNLARAARLYQESTSWISSQGSWNLGYMYELGLGVDQDFHLAKRYYDLALLHHPEAYIGVKLSLARLALKKWIYQKYGWHVAQNDQPEDPQAGRTWKEWFDAVLNIRTHEPEQVFRAEENQDNADNPEDVVPEEIYSLIVGSLIILLFYGLQIWLRFRGPVQAQAGQGQAPAGPNGGEGGPAFQAFFFVAPL